MVTIIRKGDSKDEIRKKLQKVFRNKTNVNHMQYAGKLKTEINPDEYQKKMRDEWE